MMQTWSTGTITSQVETPRRRRMKKPATPSGSRRKYMTTPTFWTNSERPGLVCQGKKKLQALASRTAATTGRRCGLSAA